MIIIRNRFIIRGIVQGVGFRPFVYRIAHESGLVGWVCNTPQGVIIEVQGNEGELGKFTQRLFTELPPHAFIAHSHIEMIPIEADTEFIIRPSDHDGAKTAYILPDLALCPDCLREMNDPTNRRYQYPFINCTHCGPRYTIMRALPYDRPNTTMHTFTMCADCQAEYDNPSDRRFHAQPIACPVCGPHIEFWDADGIILATHQDAIRACADALRAGKIIALKGLGGFHLLADATHPDAITLLRQRKHRPHKPLAVMFPDMAMLKQWCRVNHVEHGLLCSSAAPIVLLEKRFFNPTSQPPLHPRGEGENNPHSPTSSPKIREGEMENMDCRDTILRVQHTGGILAVPTMLTDMVSPNNPTIGAMLPYTPLHHLLLAECGFPLVATSGNQHDEPICIDEQEALTRLRGIADLFLVHNRPILRPVDDSVVRVMAGRMMMIRRARGYAPLPIMIKTPLSPQPPFPITWRKGEQESPLSTQWGGDLGVGLGVGAHLKNAVAIRRGDEIFISQHIGDLATTGANHHFERTITDLCAMLDVIPTHVMCDKHLDYASTVYAKKMGLPITPVQHHVAHALACMTENVVKLPALAVVWDGTGYGDDGTIWGGEFLRMTAHGYERVGYLRPFPLLGGDSAVVEPRRTALGWAYSLFGETVLDDETLVPVRQFTPAQRRVFKQMLAKGLNSPMTSSMGRLFDAVASLTDVCQVMTHEAQAAVMLENIIHYPHSPQGGEGENAPLFSMQWGKGAGGIGDIFYPYDIHTQNNTHIIHPHALFTALRADMQANTPQMVMSQKFHATLIDMIIQMAHRIGEKRVMLAGGCFLNKPLLEGAVYRLREAGFTPHWHSQIPTGDGGVCVGQVVGQ